MSQQLKWRTRAKLALESYFRRHSFPRLALSLLLTLTGLAGFLISYGLLHLGLLHMGLRYPLALLGAYAFFLALLRLWVELEQRRFDPSAIKIETPTGDTEEEDEPAGRSSNDSWLDWLDFTPDWGDAVDGDGCLIVVLFGAAIVLLISLIVTIASAPLLLAEVFLDAFLVAALYQRLRIAAREHWLGTAVRKTWRTVLLWALLLCGIGWILETVGPGHHTLGSAIKNLRFP